MPIDERLLGNITRTLATLHAAVSEQASAVTISLDGDMSHVHGPDGLLGLQGVQTAMAWLAWRIPATAHPLMITFDPQVDKTPRISLGGVAAQDVETIETTVRDVLFIEEILGDRNRVEPELFAIGRAGKMNLDQRIATVWAGSATEAMLKLLAVVEPGYSANGTFALEATFADDLEMREVSSWRKTDIEDALEEARDGIRAASTRNEPDFG